MQRFWGKPILGAAVAALMAPATGRPADLGYSFRSLATLDSTVAGEPIYDDLVVEALNANGALAFGTESINGEAAFLIEPDGKQIRLVQYNEPTPVGGKFGGHIWKIDLNDTGSLLLSVDADLGDGDDAAVLLFDQSAGRWTLVVKKGMPAPDGGAYRRVIAFSLNGKNEVVFEGLVTPSGAGPGGYGVFHWSGGRLTTIARPGTMTERATLTAAYEPQVNDNGVVTFLGQTSDFRLGAYMWKDGHITDLAPPGSPVPGGSFAFIFFEGVVANKNGDVAMLGQSVAMLGQSDAGWGVYLYAAKDKTLHKIVAPGDEMPGGGRLGDAMHTFSNSVRIGEDGSVLFEALLDSGETGVFLWKEGKMGVVERDGQELKGIGIAMDNNGDGLALASNGLIAFTVITTDGKTHLVLGTPPAAAPNPPVSQ